jgi:hypothetical protein
MFLKLTSGKNVNILFQHFFFKKDAPILRRLKINFDFIFYNRYLFVNQCFKYQKCIKLTLKHDLLLQALPEPFILLGF